ncbi:MAG: hypothetical protein EOP53_10715 [Sphingobacteriales bacterium]|nr:MAG: hypothetical protein EOP53_10715 [Sphingobacteriales bacterium]
MRSRYLIVKQILVSFILTMCCNKINAQDLYDSLLQIQSIKYPQENIYIQLDKSYYTTGETVWFKAYIKAGNSPVQISTSLYVDLISEDGKVIERKTMPVIQGGAASSFVIPDTLKSSKYYIKSYTSWMLNFDSTLLYRKPINIISAVAAKRQTANQYTLSLFPEGGDLVTGLESKVAFKTNDQDGKPFEIKGSIVNAEGKIVAGFSSIHNGMGHFAFLSQKDQRYKAVWKNPAGQQQETPMPEARTDAATFSINEQNGIYSFTINRTETASESMKEFVVFAQVAGQTVYAARINLNNKTSVTAPIPTDSLPDGMMQVTLFNKASIPVAERLIFINNNNHNFITDLHIIEKNIKSKGRNVLQVDVGGNLKSNLSISVTDADLDIKPIASENIYSQMLLSGDLKGTIYNPGYYFVNDADSIKKQLDLVMMTNGWRRFNWQKLLAGDWPALQYKPENYLSITGNAFGLNATDLNNKMITGFIQTTSQSDRSLFTAPVNKDGSFHIDNMYFFDTIKLYYQFNADKNKRLTNLATFSFRNNLVNTSKTDLNFLPGLSFAPQPPTAIALKSIKQNELNKEQQFSELAKVKTLESVVVTGKVKSPEEKLNEKYTSSLFSSGNSKIFDIENDPLARSAMSVLDYLRGRIPGLQISTNAMGGGSISRRGSNTDLFFNEMQADVTLIQSTQMTEVAMIKVFDPPFFGSFGGGAGGAVAVYTKKGGSANAANVQGLNVTTILGYSAIKEFYSPNYETNTSALPDYRTTLYWNPFLLMNPQQKRVTIPFFNNDSGKRIRVIIEGMNEEGKLTREEKIFE